ncbi:hypothetical protein [Hymenobacter coccineus]|uniref:Uncharacterized protein n=1 Tax=Hymenobacter coccineus TaxID=1908235 RepID=A0A1G1SXY2_9BACT|nr:hypothetical protein [Hymenobacter coccineus]OGX83492.1 hypothetical protein BEN49_12410 [Hymenobacter coccineus]
MKKLLLLSACLLALAARPAAAQTPSPEIVVVRIYEFPTKVHLVITRGEGKSEVMEFDSGASDKRLTASGEGYYKFINKLYQEGYALQSTFPGNQGFTTLLLVKRP